jgi:hypothetical protein
MSLMMHGAGISDEAIIDLGPRVWRWTTDLRRTLHGGRRCPQRRWPLARHPGDALCHPCSERWQDVVLRVAEKVAARDGSDCHAYLRRMTANMWFDARDAEDAVQGRLVRLERLRTRAWFRRLGDDLDRQLLILAMYFARSHDSVERSIFPFMRWAELLQADAVEIEERLWSVLDRMAELEPDRFEANVVGPLSVKLTEYTTPVTLTLIGSIDAGFDAVDEGAVGRAA